MTGTLLLSGMAAITAVGAAQVVSAEQRYPWKPIRIVVPYAPGGGGDALARLPELPTISEAGLPGYDAGNWIGLFAPAKTPRPVVTRLDSVFREVILAPEMKAKLLTLGFESDASGTREFTATVAGEIAKWRKLIAQSGAKPQ